MSARVASLKYAAHRHFVQTRGSYRLQNEGDIHISFAKAGCVKSSMTPGSPATRTLFPSVWAAAAAPASVLTAARKLKDSWILRRLRGVIVATALKLGR